MIAVIFEAWPNAAGEAEYRRLAGELRELMNRDGFISIEPFESVQEEGKTLSLSFWRDEQSIAAWRNEVKHRMAQKRGREALYHRYRIRVATVTRDYTDEHRDQAPDDSNEAHG